MLCSKSPLIYIQICNPNPNLKENTQRSIILMLQTGALHSDWMGYFKMFVKIELVSNNINFTLNFVACMMQPFVSAKRLIRYFRFWENSLSIAFKFPFVFELNAQRFCWNSKSIWWFSWLRWNMASFQPWNLISLQVLDNFLLH